MKIITIISILATFLFTTLYITTENRACLSLAITAGTIAYHFLMRYIVAMIVRCVMNNQADLSKWWYRQKRWEKRLYQKLRVKQWKGKMPTYNPDDFNLKQHTPREIACIMCQAELGHEIIVVLSFLPLLMVLIFDDFWAFFITSLLAALLDMMFVIIQRYNCPRILSLFKKRNYY